MNFNFIKKSTVIISTMAMAGAFSTSVVRAEILDLSVFPVGSFNTSITVGDYKFTPLTDGTQAPAQIVKVNGVFGVSGTDNSSGDNLKLSRTDGKAFNLVSVDIGLMNSSYNNGAEVNTIGNGGYVNLDGVAGATLQTITFDSSFANIQTVQLNSLIGPYFSNINVVSAVPEPETYAMLFAGLGLMGFMTRRKSGIKTM